MKIAIFENEYDSVKGCFEAANLFYFENKLSFTNYPSASKSIVKKLNEFSVIFIDIDLSSKSPLDGYALIEQIQLSDINLKKVVILTGNNKIEESLTTRKINPNLIKIIIKPTNFSEIATSIKSVLNKV